MSSESNRVPNLCPAKHGRASPDLLPFSAAKLLGEINKKICGRPRDLFCGHFLPLKEVVVPSPLGSARIQVPLI